MATPEHSGELVGRAAQLALLRDAVVGLVAGRGFAIWVDGSPGVGKTALLDRAAREAAALGCQSYRASGDEALQPFPFWTLLDGLRPALRSDVAAAGGVAAGLSGPAGHPTASVMGLPAGGLAGMEYQLCELIERLSGTRPVALFLDQAEWADAASLATMRRLAGTVRQLPLLLMVAVRTGASSPGLAELRAEMVAAGTAVSLGPLDPDHAIAAVAGMLGARPGPALAELVVRAGGNPFLLRELITGLGREGAIGRQGQVVELNRPGVVLPSSLGAAVLDHLSGLSGQIWPAMRMAAVLADEFTGPGLAEMLDEPTPDLAALLDEAVAVGVLVRTRRGFAFRQSLIREALLDRIPATLRPMLHLKAARAMSANGAELGRIAGHVLAAIDTHDEFVVRWVRDNAEGLTYRAPQLAADMLAATSAVAGEPDATVLRAALVRASYRLGRMTTVLAVGQPLLADATSGAVAGELTWAVGYALVRLGRLDEAVAVTTESLRRWQPEGLWAARLAALVALAEAARGNFGVAETAAQQALSLGRAISDSLSAGYALHVLSLLVTYRDQDEPGSLTFIEEALGVLGAEPDDADLRIVLLGNRAATLASLDRTSEHPRVIVEALAAAEQLGIPARLANLRLHAAEFYFTSGRWDDALAELSGALEILVENPPRLLMLHGLSALIAALRNDRAALADHVERAVAVEEGIGEGMRGIYGTYLTAARAVAAERELGPGAALSHVLPADAVDVQAIVDNPPALGVAWTVRLAQAAGRGELLDDLLTLAESMAQRTPTPSRQADERHCRALIKGDGAEAASASRALLAAGRPLSAAHAMENAAVLSARAGEMEQARRCHRDAVRSYEELGADWDISRADARLREHGLRRGRSAPRSRPAKGWEALSPNEVRVARMVAEGLSNAEIAAEMLLSRRTVQTHVSHILAKLDARSRVDIARQAHTADPRPGTV